MHIRFTPVRLAIAAAILASAARHKPRTRRSRSA